MNIYYDYPHATKENMKAIQDAIIAGKEAWELIDIFGENVVWDCVAVLSGNKETVWGLVDFLNGHEQICIDDWQSELIEEYVSKYHQ